MSPLVQKRAQETYAPQHDRQTKKVKELVFKGGITKGEKGIYFMALIAVVFAAYLILSNYAEMYSLNHEMQQTETQITQQQSINDGLSLQVKELSDPERILYIAQNDLGMKLNDQSVKVIHGNE
ncbi:cell division protein FtsL [Salipaludibacillus aurantiacus]|uniref:Cell division protein FtsL n=1 Tax=Salipaludibacillus aurantiacus TaxID=1601833 RepID=A0A1H9QU69_9BACI|nr:cell division protein FtsL [Salipaludibacillus aurantiacus]SER63980.1 cell division protein FtsL [Salipaludibacillus aurantiacus]